MCSYILALLKIRKWNFQYKYSFLYIFFIILLFSSYLHAATQGSLGISSEGSVEINIVKNRLIVLRGLRDFNFGTWSTGDGTLIDNDNVCVGKTDFGNTYAIRASGDGNGLDPSAFTLTNGTDQITYNVYWNDAPTATGNVPLTAGLILHGQSGSFISYLFNLFGFCFANANVEIEIPDTELSVATGGAYNGTLTLLVIPD